MIRDFSMSPLKFVLAMDLLALLRKFPRHPEPGTPLAKQVGDPSFTNPCGFSLKKALEIRDRFWCDENHDLLQSGLHFSALQLLAFTLRLNVFDGDGRYAGPDWNFKWVLVMCPFASSQSKLYHYLEAFNSHELTEAMLKA